MDELTTVLLVMSWKTHCLEPQKFVIQNIIYGSSPKRIISNRFIIVVGLYAYIDKRTTELFTPLRQSRKSGLGFPPIDSTRMGRVTRCDFGSQWMLHSAKWDIPANILNQKTSVQRIFGRGNRLHLFHAIKTIWQRKCPNRSWVLV